MLCCVCALVLRLDVMTFVQFVYQRSGSLCCCGSAQYFPATIALTTLPLDSCADHAAPQHSVCHAWTSPFASARARGSTDQYGSTCISMLWHGV